MYKIPESVLVVIHTRDLEVLLLERADRAGFWQSVTGSKDSPEEALSATAHREVLEETGIDSALGTLTDWNHSIEYDIYPYWRKRYAPGVTRNREQWFGLELPSRLAVTLAAREHLSYTWLDFREAAQRCFSPSNSQAILELPTRIRSPHAPR
jgi:dATP pyrophosphohydrolase